MVRPRIRICWAATLVMAALLAGCAGSSPDDSFAHVRDAVYQRTGERVVWNHSTADDRAAEGAVAKLLADPLTDQSAVQIALLNNRDLQATFEEIGIAQADLVQAGLLKNPVFSAAFEPASGGAGIKLQMSVVEDFLQILQIPLNKRIAGAKLQAATLTVDDAVIQLAMAVREALYKEQAAEELAALRKTAAQGADAAMDLADRMHTAGNIPDLGFYQQRASREQAQLDMSDADAAVVSSREELNMLLGMGDDQLHWTVAGPLADAPEDRPDAPDVERKALASSFHLAAARWEIAQAAAEAGVKERFALLPEADIGPSAEKESDGLWETGGAVIVPLPVFDFGQEQKAKTQAELMRARQRYLATAVRVRAEARAAVAALMAAQRRAAALKGVIIPLRKKIVEQTQLQYNGMLAGPFSLLEAREGETDADIQSIRALLDYWLARCRVERMIAGGSDHRGNEAFDGDF